MYYIKGVGSTISIFVMNYGYVSIILVTAVLNCYSIYFILYFIEDYFS
jgi:hypothetical protein